VRFAQVYQGIPVFGKQLMVHLDPKNQIVSVNGRYVPKIDAPSEPAIDTSRAVDVALDNLLGVQLEPEERQRVQTQVLYDKTRLEVYVDRTGNATLTWALTIMTTSPLGQWRYFVHARRPAVVHAFDSLANAKRRITYTADNTTDIPGRKLIDEGQRSRDQVAQAAHDGAGIVYDYYFNTFKRRGIDNRDSPIVSTVHFGSNPEESENAAWVGEAQQMIYGDGGEIFKPLPYGLDVIGHELTHGVTDNTAQLIYEGQSGALNESYSDVFSAMIDRDNWTLGEEVVLSPPFPAPFLRSLSDPNMGFYDPNNPLQGIGQPDNISEYADLPLSRRADNGGVHINSGIPNHAAYLLSEAIGREKTEQIYYRTLTQYLTPDTDFYNAALASVRAAQDLYGQAEADAVRQAWAGVGLDIGAGNNVPEAQTPTEPAPNAPAPPPEQIPQGCSELILNGGFEEEGGWVQESHNDVAIIDDELPFTGQRSAWLGGTDQEPLQYIYQEVRVPPNAVSVRLDYQRQVHEETSGLLGVFAGEATFSVLFTDQRGDVLGAVEQIPSSAGNDQWSKAEFDLSELVGKTVRLVLSAEMPRGNVSSFFVDDVSMVACTSGNGQPAPAPSAGDGVHIQGNVTNADTGRGVEGAQIFVLRPGLTATEAAADEAVRDNEVITYGVSDARGFYRTEDPLPRGQAYSVIVVAGGFRPILADNGFNIPANATNPVVADIQLRRGR
jgi:Zn-dependent metalloprotease